MTGMQKFSPQQQVQLVRLAGDYPVVHRGKNHIRDAYPGLIPYGFTLEQSMALQLVLGKIESSHNIYEYVDSFNAGLDEGIMVEPQLFLLYSKIFGPYLGTTLDQAVALFESSLSMDSLIDLVKVSLHEYGGQVEFFKFGTKGQMSRYSVSNAPSLEAFKFLDNRPDQLTNDFIKARVLCFRFAQEFADLIELRSILSSDKEEAMTNQANQALFAAIFYRQFVADYRANP